MNNIALLKTLRGFNRPYFTVADFEKILEMDRKSVYVTLNRLVNANVLTRLKRDTYVPEFQPLEIERIANEQYYPSYISFESALSRYSIVSQIPYVLTFATTRKSKRTKLGKREVEYRKIKDTYFFGYTLKNGIYIGEPEKALLDQLYMISKGRAVDETDEWSLVGVEKRKFLRYSKKFPETVQQKAKALVPRLGNQVATIV